MFYNSDDIIGHSWGQAWLWKNRETQNYLTVESNILFLSKKITTSILGENLLAKTKHFRCKVNPNPFDLAF